MNTRRIIDKNNGTTRTERCNEPALETANARFEQIGQFRVDSLAASQAGVAEKYQGIDANAQTSFVAGRAGHIVGLAWTLSTAVTAGVCTARATIAGTAVGDTANLAAPATSTSGTLQFGVPVAFNAGDKLGVKHTTDGSFTPTPHVGVDLLIRWTSVEPSVPEQLA